MSTVGHVALVGLALFVAVARRARPADPRGPRASRSSCPAAAAARARPSPAPCPRPRRPPVTAPAAPRREAGAAAEGPEAAEGGAAQGPARPSTRKSAPSPAQRLPPPRPRLRRGAARASAGIPGLDIQAPPGLGVPGGNDAERRLVPRRRAAEDLDDLDAADQDGLHRSPSTVSFTITETGSVDGRARRRERRRPAARHRRPARGLLRRALHPAPQELWNQPTHDPRRLPPGHVAAALAGRASPSSAWLGGGASQGQAPHAPRDRHPRPQRGAPRGARVRAPRRATRPAATPAAR